MSKDFIQNIIMRAFKDRLEANGLSARFLQKAGGELFSAELSIQGTGIVLALMPGLISIKGLTVRAFRIPDFADPSFDPDFLHGLVGYFLELQRIEEETRQRRNEICATIVDALTVVCDKSLEATLLD